MTSAQSMRTGGGAAPATAGAAALLAALMIATTLLTGACVYEAPRTELVAPYDGRQLWAVVPPRNESGVSIVDTAHVADMIAREAQQVDGIDVLPVNRVLEALRRLEIESVQTPAQARNLMNLLGADGVLVGSISAWDPYPPLTVGLALELYRREGPEHDDRFDPRMISRTVSGEAPTGPRSAPATPSAAAAGIFEARDQRTLASVHEYAATRHAPDSGFGPDIYLVRMDLFTQFVSHRLIRDLLRQEWRGMPVAASDAER